MTWAVYNAQWLAKKSDIMDSNIATQSVKLFICTVFVILELINNLLLLIRKSITKSTTSIIDLYGYVFS